MNKEKQKEINDNIAKDTQTDKEKNLSSFMPLNEKEQNDSKTNQNLLTLQNSACKNLKNEAKSESANIFM